MKYLPELLEHLENQTHLPDEVIISVSEVFEEHKSFVDQLKESNVSYPLIVFTTKKKQYAGINRNIAINAASSELIVCQDADDIPHKTRLEWIAKIYEDEPFDLLIHSYIIEQPHTNFKTSDILNYQDLDFTEIQHKSLKLKSISRIHPCKMNQKNPFLKTYVHYLQRKMGKRYTPGLHFGECCFKRALFSRVQYTNKKVGQDLQFIKNAFRHRIDCKAVNLPLIYYINLRSSHDKANS